MAHYSAGNMSQLTLAGKVRHSPTTYDGVTVPIYSSTSPTFALWNPLGSGKILMPIKISIGVSATATPAITSLALSQVVSTGSALGTGNPVVSFTDATSYNGRIGSSATDGGRFALAATLTSAGNCFYELGFSQATVALAPGLVSLQHNFEETIVMEPGTLIHLVGAPVAPVEKLVVSMSWAVLDYSA